MAAGKWKLTPTQRLYRRVQPHGECLEFPGGHTRAGYGTLGVQGRTVYAHRLAYELERGPIPKGVHIDHLCRNPACVRLDHLEVVSCRTNVLRGKRGILKTHCSQGHPWIPQNIYSHRGRRSCLICRNERNAAWNAAHKRQEA